MSKLSNLQQIYRSLLQKVILLAQKLVEIQKKKVNDLKQKDATTPPESTSSRIKIWRQALDSIGKDVSPKEDELGCAESVNHIVQMALGYPVGGDLSTYEMYMELRRHHNRFVSVQTPLSGDIILSPTGFGGRNGITHGHVGIVDGESVLSNNSSTGLWDCHYTLETWRVRYRDRGGFPILYYRAV